MSPAVLKGAHAGRMAPFALGLARLPPNGEAVGASGRERTVYAAELLNMVPTLQVGTRDAEQAKQPCAMHRHRAPSLSSF